MFPHFLVHILILRVNNEIAKPRSAPLVEDGVAREAVGPSERERELEKEVASLREELDRWRGWSDRDEVHDHVGPLRQEVYALQMPQLARALAEVAQLRLLTQNPQSLREELDEARKEVERLKAFPPNMEHTLREIQRLKDRQLEASRREVEAFKSRNDSMEKIEGLTSLLQGARSEIMALERELSASRKLH